MKSKRVKNFRVHIGVNVKQQVITSVDADKHKVDLEITPAGVVIDDGTKEKFVPFTNILEVDLMPYEQKAEAKK